MWQCEPPPGLATAAPGTKPRPEDGQGPGPGGPSRRPPPWGDAHLDPTRSGNELPAGGCLQQPPALPVCPHTARGFESRGVWGPRAGRCMAPSAVRPAWSALRSGYLAGAPRERPSPSACSGPGTRLSPQQPGDFPFKVSEMGPCAAASRPGSHADPQPGAPRAVLSAHRANVDRDQGHVGFALETPFQPWLPGSQSSLPFPLPAIAHSLGSFRSFIQLGDTVPFPPSRGTFTTQWPDRLFHRKPACGSLGSGVFRLPNHEDHFQFL